MNFDTSWLTRGLYQICLVLYEKNEFGAFDNYDIILPAFTFAIQDEIDIAWDSVHWGHIKFADLICEEVERE